MKERAWAIARDLPWIGAWQHMAFVETSIGSPPAA